MDTEVSLRVSEVNTYYGLSHVLFDVSLIIRRKELVCLLGRNGAGKTTTMRSIIGLTPPRTGSIKFKGEEIAGRRAHRIARMGIGYVPGDRRIFLTLSVQENLEVGRRPAGGPSDWTFERVYSLFPSLMRQKDHLGNQLSGGEQQMLTIARSLMGNPELILLDEPSEGLAPILVRMMEEQISSLRKQGLSILLAEQNVKSALKIADRGYILDKGRIFFEGNVNELKEDKEARRHLMV